MTDTDRAEQVFIAKLAEQAERAKWYLEHIVDEQLKRYRTTNSKANY